MPSSMRITAIDTYIAGNPWKNWGFVTVETDEGITGVGEGTVNCFGKTTEAAVRRAVAQVDSTWNLRASAGR